MELLEMERTNCRAFKNKKGGTFSPRYSIIFISLALTLTLTIAYLKVLSLYFWLYPGDAFLYDQILTETLNGNFGLEFTFGKFGSHYYFFLMLLLPLKIILGNQMVILLILLPVIFYFTTSNILFFTLQSLTKNSLLSLICSLLFLLTPNIIGGLYSTKHGTQLIDDLSGFIAVLFVFFLFVYEKKYNNKYYNKLFILFYILFLSLSEEFVLFGTIYFLINSIFYKKNNYFIYFLFSFILLLIEIFFRDKFFIPINMNMINVGVKSFLLILNYNEHLKFLNSIPPSLLIEYASTILAITCIFLVLIIKTGKINMLIIGLFIVGLMKCGIGYMLQDLNLRSWHNFPGIIMMIGAVSLQIAEQKNCKRISYGLNFTLVGLFLIYFIIGEIPFLKNKAQEIFIKKEYVLERKDCLKEIIKLIDNKKLSIVPDETKIEFIFNNYSRFIPSKRINIEHPPGMVDYVVMSIEQLSNSSKNIKNLSGEKDKFNILKIGFELITQNKYYLLFKRTSITDDDKQEREYYFKCVGKI
jgi:hypothetical protein